MTTYKTNNPVGSTSVKDLYDNAENLDTAVNTAEPTWLDRFGRTRLSMRGMAEAAGDATIAIEAAQQSVDAAGRSDLSREASALSATLASSNADRAEAAAEAAQLSSGIYPNITVAINGDDDFEPVADGHYFHVPSPSQGGFLDLYHRVGTDAIYVSTYPNSAFVSETLGVAMSRQPSLAAPLVEPTDPIERVVVDPAGRVVAGDPVEQNLDERLTDMEAVVDPTTRGLALSRRLSNSVPLVEPADSPDEDVVVDSVGRIAGGADTIASLKAQIDAGGGSRYGLIFVTNGQSNALGTNTGGPVTLLYTDNPWPDRLQMPNNGIRTGLVRQGGSIGRVDVNDITHFVPLVSQANSNNGQSTAITEAAACHFFNWCQTARGDVPMAVCVNIAWGGVSINSLAPGQPLYEDGVAIVQRVATLLIAAGLIPVVAYVDWDQGEADMNNPSDYADKLTALRTAANAAFVGITGQATPIPWLVTQPSTFEDDQPTPDTMGRVAQAVYDLCKANSNDFILSGPSYHLPYGPDLLHRLPHSHAIKGEFNAATLIRWLMRLDQPWLYWRGVEFDADAVVLRLWPVLPIERDLGITDPGDWGFDVYDGDGNEVAITGIQIREAGARVDLTLASVPAPGPRRRVTYALNSKFPDGNREDPEQIARGQLRARIPFGAAVLDGTPLYAYMPHSREFF